MVMGRLANQFLPGLKDRQIRTDGDFNGDGLVASFGEKVLQQSFPKLGHLSPDNRVPF
jgi:hypothetical protein